MPVDMPEDDDEEEEDEEEQDKQMEQVEEKEELESKEEEESEFGESFEKTPFRHRSPLKPPPPSWLPRDGSRRTSHFGWHAQGRDPGMNVAKLFLRRPQTGGEE